ncbi:MAG: twin-arginine translocase TatA/TatE family subunit [Gammaproteobacteria bacterium]|nr:twin-arginine translocase TatA/TatE family subunit [Gammaproteobacteria bacterium]
MGIGIKELILILVIVMLVFGTKKIKGIGSDVGGWIRDFRKAIKDGNDEPAVVDLNTVGKPVIEAEVINSPDKKNS